MINYSFIEICLLILKFFGWGLLVWFFITILSFLYMLSWKGLRAFKQGMETKKENSERIHIA